MGRAYALPKVFYWVWKKNLANQQSLLRLYANNELLFMWEIMLLLSTNISKEICLDYYFTYWNYFKLNNITLEQQLFTSFFFLNYSTTVAKL